MTSGSSVIEPVVLPGLYVNPSGRSSQAYCRKTLIGFGLRSVSRYPFSAPGVTESSRAVSVDSIAGHSP